MYLFAHNMASGQMFGSLKQFTDEAFLTANPEAYLYTPERVRKLQVEGWKYLQADDPCFSSRESQGQDTARVALWYLCGIFPDPQAAGSEYKGSGNTHCLLGGSANQ